MICCWRSSDEHSTVFGLDFTVDRSTMPSMRTLLRSLPTTPFAPRNTLEDWSGIWWKEVGWSTCLPTWCLGNCKEGHQLATLGVDFWTALSVHREEDATSLVELHLLCYPQSSFASELPETQPRDMDMVKVQFIWWCSWCKEKFLPGYLVHLGGQWEKTLPITWLHCKDINRIVRLCDYFVALKQLVKSFPYFFTVHSNHKIH